MDHHWGVPSGTESGSLSSLDIMTNVTFFPGLFAAGMSPGEMMVQAAIALPICRKILEGRLTIVSPSRVSEPPEEEESLLNNRLSPIPLEFDPWLEPSGAVRLSGVPPEAPLALIKASLREEGVPFWWVSWSAVPGEVLVEPGGSMARRALLRRGLVLCGGGPRLRARPTHDDEPGYAVSANELLEATRCEPSPNSLYSSMPRVKSAAVRDEEDSILSWGQGVAVHRLKPRTGL